MGTICCLTIIQIEKIFIKYIGGHLKRLLSDRKRNIYKEALQPPEWAPISPFRALSEGALLFLPVFFSQLSTNSWLFYSILRFLPVEETVEKLEGKFQKNHTKIIMQNVEMLNLFVRWLKTFKTNFCSFQSVMQNCTNIYIN